MTNLSTKPVFPFDLFIYLFVLLDFHYQKMKTLDELKKNIRVAMIRLYKSWCVVMHMLGDRGYEIPEDSKYYCQECDKDMLSDGERCNCYNNFIEWVGDNESDARKKMVMIFKSKKDSVMTFWTSQCGGSDIQRVEEQMNENGVFHSILVHNNKITSSAANAIKNLKIQGHLIEPFHEGEVQYVVTRSKLVPKHIICGKKKTEEILKAYNIEKHQLPEIQSTDPVVRYIGARRGQVIKIVRPSESIGFLRTPSEKKVLYDIFYRIVV